jgi:hypothetical protein
MNNGRECTGAQPPLALLEDRRPWREVVRHHPPFRPRTHDPAQGVEDVAQGVIALRDVEAHQGEVGDDKSPFGIADIGRVRLAFAFASRIHTPECTAPTPSS